MVNEIQENEIDRCVQCTVSLYSMPMSVLYFLFFFYFAFAFAFALPVLTSRTRSNISRWVRLRLRC